MPCQPSIIGKNQLSRSTFTLNIHAQHSRSTFTLNIHAQHSRSTFTLNILRRIVSLDSSADVVDVALLVCVACFQYPLVSGVDVALLVCVACFQYPLVSGVDVALLVCVACFQYPLVSGVDVALLVHVVHQQRRREFDLHGRLAVCGQPHHIRPAFGAFHSFLPAVAQGLDGGQSVVL